MSRKTDAPTKRLERLRQLRAKPSYRQIEEFVAQGVARNPTLFAKLQLPRSYARAFAYFGLDPKNPDDWRELLGLLVEAHFGERPRGRRPEWTRDRILRARVLAIKERISNLSGAEVARRIKRRWPDEYKGIKDRTLAKYVSEIFRAIF